MSKPRDWSVAELAGALGYSETRIRAWCRDARIEARQPSGYAGTWRIPAYEAERLVSAGVPETAETLTGPVERANLENEGHDDPSPFSRPKSRQNRGGAMVFPRPCQHKEHDVTSKQTQHELDHLKADAAKLEQLLAEHRGAEAAAKAAARANKMEVRELAEVQARARAVAELVSEHEAEVASLEAQLQEQKASEERQARIDRLREIGDELENLQVGLADSLPPLLESLEKLFEPARADVERWHGLRAEVERLGLELGADLRHAGSLDHRPAASALLRELEEAGVNVGSLTTIATRSAGTATLTRKLRAPAPERFRTLVLHQVNLGRHLDLESLPLEAWLDLYAAVARNALPIKSQ